VTVYFSGTRGTKPGFQKQNKNATGTLQLRETRREMGRRELKPTYLELPPLPKGCIWSKRSSQEQPGQDYFKRRRRRLVKLILI